VAGRSLLGELEATIRRFIVLNEQGIVVSVLWITGTYVFQQFPIFPRLFATAPERGCGKTTLLDLLELLTPRAVKVENITTAALFRTIEAARPTMLLDEADTFVPHSEELRGVVDSGHKRNGAVIRLVEIAGQYVPHKFSTFAPMALAAIKRLPGTIEDRSLLVHMKRRRKDEEVESLYHANGITNVARKLARWSDDNGAELSVADPEMPDGIMNRTANNWHPMFAIADRIGGDWPSRARQVAVALNSEGDTGSVEIELLADIRAAFEASPTAPALSSDQLVAGLILLEDRPWGEIKNGRPLTKHGLARYLRSFHISPGTIRLSNGTTPKGYKLEQFKDAFERYLPPTPPSPAGSTATTPQAAENKANGPDFEPQQETSCGGLKTAENPSNSAACGDVAVQSGERTGETGEKADSEPKSPTNGDARENGYAELDHVTVPRRLTKLEREIIAYNEANPGLSLELLRKKFGGRSKEAIAELLGRAP
jgi:putative DNA primase/helicase